MEPIVNRYQSPANAITGWGMIAPAHSGISVFIANPHSMTLELLSDALKRHRHFHVFGSARNAQDAIDMVKSVGPDVALITATLADGPMSGIGAVRQIRECAPDVKSVILLNGPERNLVVDAFRAGARGVFFLSQSTFKSLCRCVEQIFDGQIWASSSELAEVMDAFTQLAPMRVVNGDGMRLLTKREEDVVRLVAGGMQNRDIAQELRLSEHTVKNYLFHIFDKLGVSSRVELVLYAVTSTRRLQASDTQAGSELAGGTVHNGFGSDSPGHQALDRSLKRT
jgi:DNA-binding NarL/FixJ family response regulator